MNFNNECAFFFVVSISKIFYQVEVVSKSESESESALFAKCVQTHEEFVVVFKKLCFLLKVFKKIYIFLNPYPSS